MDKRRIQHPKLNTQKIQKQINQLGELSRKKEWEYYYDNELDQLFFSPNVIPDHNILMTLGNDLSIYVDSDSNINGVFIEYFKTNFSEHHQKLKEVKKIFSKRNKIKAKDSSISKNNILIQFEEVIREELLEELQQKSGRILLYA